MTGNSAAPHAVRRASDGVVEVLGSTHGLQVGMRVRDERDGVDYFVTSIDGDTFRLSEVETPLTGEEFENAVKAQPATSPRKRTRCDRCNAINAPDERRCTMCGRGRCR